MWHTKCTVSQVEKSHKQTTTSNPNAFINRHEAHYIPTATSGVGRLSIANTLLQRRPRKGASEESDHKRCRKHRLCQFEWRVSIPKIIDPKVCADMCRTKGGAGGPTTTVSTLPQLSAAAAVTGPLIIVVQGAISGAAKVNVTSNKTIVGKSGSCKYKLALSSI